MGLTQEQIREQVWQALARSLTRSPREIRGADTLVNDLGMDSLDFLDLMFALEKAFQVKIRDADFDRLLKPTQSDTLPPHLTDEEVRAMEPMIPGIVERAQQGRVARNSVLALMTADSLVAMIALKLQAQGH